MTVGSGNSTIYNEAMFVKRATVLKKYVDEDRDLQVQILYALQVSITKLEHPPSEHSHKLLLYSILYFVYFTVQYSSLCH